MLVRPFTKNIIYALVLSILLLPGCNSDNSEIHELDTFFDIEIPAGLNTIESHFFLVENVPTFISGFLENGQYTEDDLVRVNGVTATFMTRFSNLDLDFIDRMTIHALDANNPTVKRELFYLEFIPFGSKTEIQLIPSIENVADFFCKDFVDIEFRVDLRGFLPNPIDGRVEMRLHIFDE